MLTVDIAVLARGNDGWQVLLIRRDRAPQAGAWAVPGGKVKADEPTLEAACRELAEETGVRLSPEDLVPLGLYADPGRDPRGRYASLLHVAVLPTAVEPHAGSDAGDARWWPLVDQVEGDRDLAFDHATLLRDVRRVAPWSLSPAVRRVVESDVPLVVRLHHAALSSAGPHAGPGPWDDDLEDVASAYIATGGEFLVATAGPAILGMGALRPVDDMTAEVKRMRVLPRWQGHGVGRAIAEALLDRAGELGFRRLVLDTTRRQTAAIGLYTSLGFTQIGAAVVAGLPSLLFAMELPARE